MTLIYAILGAVVQGIIKYFFPAKTTNDKAVEALIAEKTETIKKVDDAKKIREGLVNDPAFAARMRDKYTRDD